jgi:hypothetical protein
MNTKTPLTPYVLEFKLIGLPKMSNALLRGHWRVKHAHAVKWKGAVERAMRILNKPPQPLEWAMLTLTRVSSVEPDHDGLVSSFKPILDGLVECGVLADDKRAVVGVPDYRWEKGRPGHGHVKVRVEELTSANK